MQHEPWIKITYTTPESEISAEEKAARGRYDAAIEHASEQYHQESRLQDVLGIELYPCDCEQCTVA